MGNHLGGAFPGRVYYGIQRQLHHGWRRRLGILMEDCRMKKTLLILAALVGAAFVSCQKENNLEPSEPELGGKTYTLTVQAT